MTPADPPPIRILFVFAWLVVGGEEWLKTYQWHELVVVILRRREIGNVHPKVAQHDSNLNRPARRATGIAAVTPGGGAKPG